MTERTRLGLAAAAAALALSPAAWGMGKRPPKAEGGAMENATGLTVSEVSPNEWRGQYCGVAEPDARVIGDLREWEKLWREAFSKTFPAVDFGKHLALAVFLGTQRTGGYSIEFLEPLADKDNAILRYKLHAPSARQFVTQAFTQPYAVKLYKKSPLKVQVLEVKETR